MSFSHGVSFLRNRVQSIAVLAVLVFSGHCSSAFAQGLPPMSSMPPYAMDDFYTTSYNTPIIFNPLNNDMPMMAPLDPSSLSIEVNPGHGTVQVDRLTGLVEYTPNSGFSGPDAFFYTVADTNGNVSNVALVSLNVINLPPTVISFTATEGSGNVWLFQGQIIDEDPASCEIIFGGLLEGESTTPNTDGFFSFSKSIPEDVNGSVSAEAEDELSLISDPLYEEVYHY